MLKIEPGNEALMDGQTDDGQTNSNTSFFGGYNIIPHTF